MLKLANINSLLQQEVSRKEFLRYAGLIFLGLIGVTALLQNIQKSIDSPSISKKTSGGYGASAYGE